MISTPSNFDDSGDGAVVFERREVIDSDDFFNSQFEETPLYINPGEVVFGEHRDQMLVAKLGSGVFVSVFDVDLKIGAVAYIILPQAVLDVFPHFGDADQDLVKKAMEPVESCLGEMKRRGAGKNRIKVSLVGGASLPGAQSDEGTKNYVFVREALKQKGLKIFQEDLGGESARRVHFFPTSGKIVRKHLNRKDDLEFVEAKESAFHKNSTISV